MQFSDQLIEVLDAICKKIGVVIDWTVANVVPYVQDLVHRVIVWQIMRKGVWALAVIIMLVLSFVFADKLRKHNIKENRGFEWMDPSAIGVVMLYMFGGIMGFVLISIINSTLQMIYVPEIWFIDFVRGYVQTAM